MRLRITFAVLAVIAAACGGAEVDPPAADGSTTTTAAPATSVVSTTTAAPATTTVAPTTLPPAELKPLEILRLANGLPATFVAVTEGWEAVEVDTATGNILRSIGRMERPGEADDEGGVWAAVQQVWRTADQLWYVVSECCEPAGGMIHYLGPETTLTRANHDDTLSSDGWTVSPSPFDGRLARLGYYLHVAPVGGESAVDLWFDQPGGPAMPSGVAAWDQTGTMVSWTSSRWDEETVNLLHADISSLQPEIVEVELEWVGPDQWLDGMGRQESGNYVAFLHTSTDDFEAPETILTEGVVFSADGTLVATFPVETGSYWGGYDPSGKVLIYTDGDNNVRWQGLGQSGVLADGFIHASW